MRRVNQRAAGIIIWIIVVGILGNLGAVSRLFSSGAQPDQTVTEDDYMTTKKYDTVINIHEDNSYTVAENIQVSFDVSRHGIYRYIPYKGVITAAKADGTVQDTPYYAEYDKIKSTVPLKVTQENGNKVFRFGDEEDVVSGEQEYQFSYHITPIAGKGYESAYYNVFPAGWRNEIPAGSSFTLHFPKEIDKDIVKFYWGNYGEQKSAEDITDLQWKGTTVTGVLKQSLPVGSGMTFYAPVEKGYFNNVASTMKLNIPFLIVTAVIVGGILLLFLLFGRDTSIIPSIQFQPPAGLDSAAVGYIIDGSVSNEDVVSLFVFWADRGFIKIRETKNKKLAFTKLKDLPKDAPQYAVKLFDKVFGKGSESIGKEVLVSSLKYKLADTFSNTKVLLKQNYKGMYTIQSRVARWISTVLSMVPAFMFAYMLWNMTFANLLVMVFAICYLVGLILFNTTVDFWYSRAKRSRMLMGSAGAALCIVPPVMLFFLYGISMIRGRMLNLFPSLVALIISSVVCMVFTGFMKKRTKQCIEWMGYLAGLRDFIETAELDRMQVIAQDNPELFYHILPFAYVFGLSDILLDKMKELSLPSPSWYETPSGNPYFDYYAMHYFLHTNMRQTAAVVATPKPPEPSSGSSGGFSGGGFSGGGFSGGGFGGGGGGSW